MSRCTRSDSKDGKCTGNESVCMGGPVCWDEDEEQARFAKQTAFTKRQMFAVLWHKAKEPSYFDHIEVQGWLEAEAWPEIFPGHCFRCHGFEDGPCHTDDGGMHNCPACLEEQ